MTQPKKSFAAVLMDAIIAAGVLIFVICFSLYYGKLVAHDGILWAGVTAFTITYHLWMRIIMGNLTKRFSIHYTHPWFSERPFEKKLYRFLRVKAWKDKVLTYNPELFSLTDYSLDEVANTMAKAETDHWINELISLSTLLFGLVWGEAWIFALTALFAMAFDGQFIVIQRYNRPRVLKILSKKAQAKEPAVIR